MHARSASVAFCLSILLTACSGSGSSGTTSTASNNSESGTLVVKGTFGALPSPLAAAIPGDGVWNYSVATDYFYGSPATPNSPSLAADFQNNSLAKKITYVFPVFGYLDQKLSSTNPYPSSAQQTCPDFNGSYTQTVFSYYALPQIKPVVSSVAASVLGTCVDGPKVTQYYTNKVGIPQVVPVIEMSPAFNAAIVYQQSQSQPYQFGADELVQLAQTIATTILNDPNVYGVAFDNEPAISKATSDPNNPVVNCQGLDLEHLFYGTLAHALATANPSKPKYLFLFDAPDTARALYTAAPSVTYGDKAGNSHTCPYSATPTKQPAFPPLTNIVMKPALYDLETATGSGPLDLATYKTDVNKAVQSALSLPNDPPVMLVLPASATDTMWSGLQTYNTKITSGTVPVYKNLQTSSCDTAVKTSGTPNYIAVTSIICLGDNVNCPGEKPLPRPIPPYSAQANVDSFYSQCVASSNTSAGMNDYFNVGLDAVNKSNIAGPGKARFLGVSLYAWRIPETADILGAINYYSVYGDKSLWKVSPQTLPMEITKDAWTSYLGWPNPLASGK